MTKAKEVLERPSQSLDSNPIEMCWHDLKQAFCVLNSSNVAEFKQFYKEDLAKNSSTVM